MKRPTIQPGDWNIVCQRTGFRLPMYMIRREWNGLLVYDKVWEPRQEQDYLRGIPDKMTVPYGNPKTPPVFVGTVTPNDL